MHIVGSKVTKRQECSQRYTNVKKRQTHLKAIVKLKAKVPKVKRLNLVGLTKEEFLAYIEKAIATLTEVGKRSGEVKRTTGLSSGETEQLPQ